MATEISESTSDLHGHQQRRAFLRRWRDVSGKLAVGLAAVVAGCSSRFTARDSGAVFRLRQCYCFGGLQLPLPGQSAGHSSRFCYRTHQRTRPGCLPPCLVPAQAVCHLHTGVCRATHCSSAEARDQGRRGSCVSVVRQSRPLLDIRHFGG